MAFSKEAKGSASFEKVVKPAHGSRGQFGIGRFGQARFGNIVTKFNKQAKQPEGFTKEAKT